MDKTHDFLQRVVSNHLDVACEPDFNISAIRISKAMRQKRGPRFCLMAFEILMALILKSGSQATKYTSGVFCSS